MIGAPYPFMVFFKSTWRSHPTMLVHGSAPATREPIMCQCQSRGFDLVGIGRPYMTKGFLCKESGIWTVWISLRRAQCKSKQVISNVLSDWSSDMCISQVGIPC